MLITKHWNWAHNFPIIISSTYWLWMQLLKYNIIDNSLHSVIVETGWVAYSRSCLISETMCHVQSGVDFWLLFKINIIFREKSSQSNEWVAEYNKDYLREERVLVKFPEKTVKHFHGCWTGKVKYEIYIFSVSCYEAAPTTRCVNVTAPRARCQWSYHRNLLHFRTLGWWTTSHMTSDEHSDWLAIQSSSGSISTTQCCP